jgi:hypothetical protein
MAAVAAAGGWSASKTCMSTAARVTARPSLNGTRSAGAVTQRVTRNTAVSPPTVDTKWPTMTCLGRATRR